MSSVGSVTQWIGELKAGNHDAAQNLWERYFQQLVGLARKKLWGDLRRVGDEEDVALSAFDSFFRGAEHGRFPFLSDRDNLWPLLVKITERKAIDLIQNHFRIKRGGGTVQGESDLDGQGNASPGPSALDQIVGKEPTPEFAVQMAENLKRLLEDLPDDDLRKIALGKMEGYKNAEIAEQLGCAEVTVERRLQRIRTIWDRESCR